MAKPGQEDPQLFAVSTRADNSALRRFASVSVRSYNDGTMAATLSVWNPNNNRTSFIQLPRPQQRRSEQPWAVEALLTAVLQMSLDEECVERLR